MGVLIDTNVLVYRFDERFPEKRAQAETLLRKATRDQVSYVPHQAIVEFVSAVTRVVNGRSILSVQDSRREAEELLDQFQILYPDEAVVRTALRGAAAYQLSWWDAQIWAYAEVHGLGTLYSEDFEHLRRYGRVQVVDPFAT